MSPEQKAMNLAKEAWIENLEALDSIRCKFDEKAFNAALRAYISSLAHAGDHKPPPPKESSPATRSFKEHFLAMSTGHYQGYTLTVGRTGSTARDVICFQPDAKSSILLPLFMSVHPIHDALTDQSGRKLDVEIKVND